MEGGLVIALVVEKHADGRYTIFIPAAPTPFTGSIHILPAERVHLSTVSLAKALQCISRYGIGSHELLAAVTRSQMTPATAVEAISSSSPCS
jgi:uncharacterized membrane protein